MADLKGVFGGSWTPPGEKHIDPPAIQFRDAMINAGIEPPDQILFDGKIHRFRSGTNGKHKAGDKTGWYVAFGEGVPAGRFGCWRADIEMSFRADVGRQISAAEEMALARQMAEARKLREAEQKKKQEAANISIESIWQTCGSASECHPYLERKGVKPHGSRVTGDGRLIVPLYDEHGELASLQYIDNEGGKLYHSGASTKGLSWLIGEAAQDSSIYIAEGFATAATIHEATGKPCYAAYSASNLPLVAKMLRERYGQQQDIIVVADNDEGGIGQKYADQASAKYSVRVIMPPIQGDANDYAQAGHDILELLIPQTDTDWLIPADEFCQQPSPISWLIKGWLQRDALIMIHGPSGGGKTFCVLDMCLRMASGIEQWADNRVTKGNVVYLAGEGHHGLKSRIAGWKAHNQVDQLSMWLSKGGCDLNTAEGYHKTVDSLRMLPERPDVIIVDTLHRFLLGDENSAQDAKTMLDACNALMSEFCCSVVLVHHTGVSGEAQHRARGSSAWKGALDIEISVVPAEDESPMQIVQRKSKDAELSEDIYAYLESAQVPGWIDEDGEQVTTAVLSITDDRPKEPEKKESKIDNHKKVFERAWWSSGAEIRNGAPYLSRSGFKAFLSEQGYKEGTIKNHMKPSYENGYLYSLVNGEVVESFEHGWKIVDEIWGSALNLRAGSK